jgi:hypothetical protein
MIAVKVTAASFLRSIRHSPFHGRTMRVADAIYLSRSNYTALPGRCQTSARFLPQELPRRRPPHPIRADSAARRHHHRKRGGRPSGAAGDAAEATRGAIALVDGMLWPWWSRDGESELWWLMQNPPFSRSTILGAAGHGCGSRSRRGVLHNPRGAGNTRPPDTPPFRSPLPATSTTGRTEGNSCREDPEEGGRGFGDKGFIGSDYITTPIRKPE